MKQSRENYVQLAQNVESSNHAERLAERAARFFRSKGDELSAKYIELRIAQSRGNKVYDSGVAENNLQQYMNEGLVNASELNETYDQLQQAVNQAESELLDLPEEANEHGQEFDLVVKKFQKAVHNLEEFKVKKLRTKPTT